MWNTYDYEYKIYRLNDEEYERFYVEIFRCKWVSICTKCDVIDNRNWKFSKEAEIEWSEIFQHRVAKIKKGEKVGRQAKLKLTRYHHHIYFCQMSATFFILFPQETTLRPFWTGQRQDFSGHYLSTFANRNQISSTNFYLFLQKCL